jgi:hypothetical protein
MEIFKTIALYVTIVICVALGMNAIKQGDGTCVCKVESKK